MLKHLLCLCVLVLSVASEGSDSCGPNERYEENPSQNCQPLKCSELGVKLDCPNADDPNSNDDPACVCEEGYVRDNSDVCVPKSECPSCGGDPNAVAGSGVNCGKTCSTYGKNVACIRLYYTNGCDCRDEFVYDDVVKKCVKYEDCSKTDNES